MDKDEFSKRQQETNEKVKKEAAKRAKEGKKMTDVVREIRRNEVTRFDEIQTGEKQK